MSSPLAIDRAEDIPQYIHAQGSMNHCRQPSLHIIYYPGCVQSGQVGIMGCLWECRYTPPNKQRPHQGNSNESNRWICVHPFN